MDTNIQSIIKQHYDQLPKDVKEAITNSDLGTKFSKIAEKHGLLLDQNGALQTETILVMLGLESTGDYVKNIQRELEISNSEAESISADVNAEILNSIKTSLREIEEKETVEEDKNSIEEKVPISFKASQPSMPKPITFSSLEKVGDFKIEQGKPVSHSSQYEDMNLVREKVLKDIENPPKSPSGVAFVDHLLAKPVMSVPEVKKIQVPTAPSVSQPAAEKKPIPPPSRLPGVDPYREPLL